jgi:uncharacterized damage-inducible protein DinB
MDSQRAFAAAVLEQGHRMLVANIDGISIDEALEAAGGFRSILGILKHVAGWNAVYYSFAFDPEPRHWTQTDWPRGLRDRIEPTSEYLDELVDWFESIYERWLGALNTVDDLDTARPLHWGDTAPLPEIVTLVAAHWLYHAGEINAILAIRREEAWEHMEEVEENHISTVGHRVRPPWMTDDEWTRFVAEHP